MQKCKIFIYRYFNGHSQQSNIAESEVHNPSLIKQVNFCLWAWALECLTNLYFYLTLTKCTVLLSQD